MPKKAMPKETVSQQAVRLTEEVQILSRALVAMTNGTFKWGEWRNADLRISETNVIRRSVRYGVARDPHYPMPILLRELSRDGKSNNVQPLTVDQLMRQPAMDVLNSGVPEFKQIFQGATKLNLKGAGAPKTPDDDDDESGTWEYIWPKEAV